MPESLKKKLLHKKPFGRELKEMHKVSISGKEAGVPFSPITERKIAGSLFSQHAETFKRLTGKHHSMVNHSEMYRTLVENKAFGMSDVVEGMLDQMQQANAKIGGSPTWHQENSVLPLERVLNDCGFQLSEAELAKAVKKLPKKT